MSTERAYMLLLKLSTDLDYFRTLAELNNKERIERIKKDGYHGFTEEEFLEGLYKTIMTPKPDECFFHSEEKDAPMLKVCLPTYSAFDPGKEKVSMSIVGETVTEDYIKNHSVGPVRLNRRPSIITRIKSILHRCLISRL